MSDILRRASLGSVTDQASAFRRQAFQDVYASKKWGCDNASAFFSGAGSRGEALKVYVKEMGAILQRHRVEHGVPFTIVDLGCGDFFVSQALLRRVPGCHYIGCDIVPELITHNSCKYGSGSIEFCETDIVEGPLPLGNVYLIRQVFQHLPNHDIAACLRLLGQSRVYVTEGHPRSRIGPVNPDRPVGHEVRFDWKTGVGRGVELDQPPFNMGTREVFRATASPHEIIITEELLT